MEQNEPKDMSEFCYAMSEYDELLIDSVKALGGFVMRTLTWIEIRL